MYEHLVGKTLLVTGATGFIGAHLVQRLQQLSDTQLILLSRQAAPNISIANNCTWVQSSLNSLSASLWETRNIQQIHAVIHLAGFIPKIASQANNINEVFEHNLIGTRHLLENLPCKPEQIVFASTVDVYGAQARSVLDETCMPNPDNLYGASNWFCEQLVRAGARKIDCAFVVLRYGHIYGPGEEAYSKLIPQTIRTLLKGETSVIYGDGSAARDYLYVEDAVEATLRAILRNDLNGETSTLR